MQTTEVTQGQWLAVVGGTNPSYYDSCGMDCPVEQVSWNDAKDFIAVLNVKEDRTNCKTTFNTCYSLPTEVQWEYAAWAGAVTAFYNGDITQLTGNDPNLNQIGWYAENSSSTTHSVAQKAPNNWGLYDMSGNVLEWCQDSRDVFGTYPDLPVTDPTGNSSGSDRVHRGSSLADPAEVARSASRRGGPPDDSGSLLGFQLFWASGQ